MNKAVFLDRDGTINKEVDYLSRIEEFEFLPSAVKALVKLSKSSYKIIVITNQSGVARGYFTEVALGKIHGHMVEELKANGARVDGIYVCPHHPDENCDCRKPKTGLIRKAEKDFNLDVKNSYIVGDSTKDVQTGINAGCKTILVKTGYGGKDKLYDVKPDYVVKDLLFAVENVILK